MPTQEELTGMADHVIYEIDQFRCATNKVRDLQTKRQKNEAVSNNEWNIALESMLLHFRILRDFFQEKPTQKPNRGNEKDDVTVGDYCGPWAPTKADVFSSTKDDIDKRLAHLTVRRLADKDWHELNEMRKAIESSISQFKRMLLPSFKECFRSLGEADPQPQLHSSGNSTMSESQPLQLFLKPDDFN